MRNQRYHLSDSVISEHARHLYDPALAEGKITQKDAELIREFINDQAGHISPVREYKLTGTLILCREFFPPYETITTSAAQEGVRNMLTAAKPDGTARFKPNTKTDRIRTMKRFFLWMSDNGYGDALNERKLHKIAVPSPDRLTKTVSDILTKEEVEKILRQATNSRDRALVSTLYEGGLRGRELSELTWGDIQFTSWNVVLNTAGKTGKPRRIPCVMSLPYLAAWKNDYPAEITPSAYVFVSLRKDKKTGEYLSLSYSNVSFRLKKLASKAGVEKPITTHTFRHSRVTHLLTDKVPETFVKRLMWGNMETGMIATYGHLAAEDIDDCIADMHGIRIHTEEEEVKKEKMLHPRQCSSCGTMNAVTANYCSVCGAPLTEDAEHGTESKKDELQRLLEDDTTLVEVLTFIKNLKASQAAGTAAAEDARLLPADSQ